MDEIDTQIFQETLGNRESLVAPHPPELWHRRLLAPEVIGAFLSQGDELGQDPMSVPEDRVSEPVWRAKVCQFQVSGRRCPSGGAIRLERQQERISKEYFQNEKIKKRRKE